MQVGGAAMAAEMATIQVPHTLYQRLERLAALTAQPVDRVIAQALAAGLPLLPDDLSPAWRESLLALEELDNPALERVTLATMPTARYESFVELRERAREGALPDTEAALLEELAAEVELLPLRKAYAAVHLKWRGRQIPAWTASETP